MENEKQMPDTTSGPLAKIQITAPKQGCARTVQRKGHQNTERLAWCETASPSPASCTWCQELAKPDWLNFSLKKSQPEADI